MVTLSRISFLCIKKQDAVRFGEQTGETEKAGKVHKGKKQFDEIQFKEPDDSLNHFIGDLGSILKSKKKDSQKEVNPNPSLN